MRAVSNCSSSICTEQTISNASSRKSVTLRAEYKSGNFSSPELARDGALSSVKTAFVSCAFFASTVATAVPIPSLTPTSTMFSNGLVDFFAVDDSRRNSLLRSSRSGAQALASCVAASPPARFVAADAVSTPLKSTRSFRRNRSITSWTLTAP